MNFSKTSNQTLSQSKISQLLGQDPELLAFCQHFGIAQQIEERLQNCNWQTIKKLLKYRKKFKI
jgi:hypothetical protein